MVLLVFRMKTNHRFMGQFGWFFKAIFLRKSKWGTRGQMTHNIYLQIKFWTLVQKKNAVMATISHRPPNPSPISQYKAKQTAQLWFTSSNAILVVCLKYIAVYQILIRRYKPHSTNVSVLRKSKAKKYVKSSDTKISVFWDLIVGVDLNYNTTGLFTVKTKFPFWGLPYLFWVWN